MCGGRASRGRISRELVRGGAGGACPCQRHHCNSSHGRPQRGDGRVPGLPTGRRAGRLSLSSGLTRVGPIAKLELSTVPFFRGFHGFIDQEETQEDVQAQVSQASQGQPPQEEVTIRGSGWSPEFYDHGQVRHLSSRSIGGGHHHRSTRAPKRHRSRDSTRARRSLGQGQLRRLGAGGGADRRWRAFLGGGRSQSIRPGR